MPRLETSVKLKFFFCVCVCVQISEPMDGTRAVIYWRKKDSDVFYITPNTSFGSSYSLNGLQANTSYEIQVQIMTEQHKGPKSGSAFAKTLAKPKGELKREKIVLNSSLSIKREEQIMWLQGMNFKVCRVFSVEPRG